MKRLSKVPTYKQREIEARDARRKCRRPHEGHHHHHHKLNEDSCSGPENSEERRKEAVRPKRSNLPIFETVTHYGLPAFFECLEEDAEK